MRRMGVLFSGWLILAATAAYAETGLLVHHVVIPEAPPSAGVMAGYMEIENTSAKSLKIVSANSRQFKKVEIHHTVTQGNVSKMVQIKELAVPANGKVKLQRGGLHLMLIGPQQPIKRGETVEIVLKLHTGKQHPIKATVTEASLDDDHSHHHHHH